MSLITYDLAGTYFEDTQKEAAEAWNERVGDYEEY